MRKIFALALALIMAMSLATGAFAAAPETAVTGPFKVTINNATGHEYVIYQIFTADLALNADGEEVLSNIKYGADYVPEGKNVGDDAEIPADPTSIVPTGAGTEMTTSGDKATITVEDAGYYMIKDVTDPLPGQDTRSAVIFQVVGDTDITSKHTGTTIVKKTQDINDSTGEQPTDNGSVWIDSADYDIGDTVPFKSTANFEGFDNYDTYKIVITDIMAKGLTYNRDMVITINGKEVTSGYTIAVTEGYVSEDEYNGGTQILVTFDDIKEIEGVGNDAEIVLNYSATLNSNANLGAAGNPNKIKATTTPEGEGETPWDVNIVFTFKVNVDKYTTINEEKVALSGAGFTLYKEVKTATAKSKTGAVIKAELKEKDPSIKATALVDDANYVIAAEVEVDATGAIFGFNGIDDGNYVLVETQIPAGYNAWDAEAFVIEASHDTVSTDPKLTSLTGGDLFTGEYSNSGILDTDIENLAGVELPETGGIGTTIFYVIGGLLVAAAVILLVTKKRMSSAK